MSGAPPALTELVSACLATEPGARPGAREVAKVLRAFSEGDLAAMRRLGPAPARAPAFTLDVEE